ncbi:uncharacterized protein F5Z01DRAFT_634107 [Emericellopsis atlantica]|uniref:Uncharacterized protein n=1 Tax=Emericellopsis atlantica TaxID=2614577 RepID=A0A9P7ZQU4_9HYPO|nr:uncharacterized protein F5Z01DRAFT_634107 [Emericellopsis atlantica]KAG9256525.1 hypothetical protein F5Z01DRAFT_634107 [Emericellopsis atlantica]
MATQLASSSAVLFSARTKAVTLSAPVPTTTRGTTRSGSTLESTSVSLERLTPGVTSATANATPYELVTRRTLPLWTLTFSIDGFEAKLVAFQRNIRTQEAEVSTRLRNGYISIAMSREQWGDNVLHSSAS